MNDSSSQKRRVVRGLNPKAGCLGAIVVALFFGLLGLGIGSGSSALASEASKSSFQEVLLDGEVSAKKKIVAIPIKGMIMESMGAGPKTVSKVKKVLKTIEDDESVTGILLLLDTPGGGVTASDRIYHNLLKFKKKHKIPIHSLFLDVSASGGYYIAMASEHITAHPTTVTGSIGVISKFFNVRNAMDKIGISVNVVKSLNNEGKVSFKDMGSPYRPMRDEERALLQNLITEMWTRFTDVVAAGRKGKLTGEEVRELADGRVFTGKQALEKKLIDAIGYTEDAYAEIRKASKAESAKIVYYKKAPSFAQTLGLPEIVSHSVAESPIGMASDILRSQAGFFYLWTAGGL